MVLIIVLDLISMVMSLVVFNLSRKLMPSFEKLVTPLIAIFYAVGVLVMALSILEISGFVKADESLAGVAIHLVILGIVLLIVFGLNKLRIAQLRNELEEVRLLNKMKAEFLARTSHELKTPLTPLIMQLQMLKKENFGKINSQQLECIEMIERNIKRLNALLNDILFFSRSIAGKIRLDKKPTNIDSLIKDTIKTLENKAQNKNIAVSLNEGQLPEVECDPIRIMEVLVNLLDNAIKFSNMDGKIEIETKELEKSAMVCVKDYGIGVSKKDMPKLFKPFTQIADVATREHGGTGVGLSICKSLIELHKGQIWAESQGKGKGTKLCFTLSLKKNHRKRQNNNAKNNKTAKQKTKLKVNYIK